MPKTEPAPAAMVEQVPQTQTQTPQAQQPQAALTQTPQEVCKHITFPHIHFIYATWVI